MQTSIWSLFARYFVEPLKAEEQMTANADKRPSLTLGIAFLSFYGAGLSGDTHIKANAGFDESISNPSVAITGSLPV